DAVAGDRGAAADRVADSAARPIGKMHADAGSILLDPNTMMAGDEAVAAGAGAKCIQQRHLQITAMDRELRMLIARRAAQRLLIDQLPEAIEEGGIRRRNRDLRQRLLQPERGEFLGRMRQQIGADADRPDFGYRLEDTAGTAGRVQRKPEGQAANATPDNDDVVHVSFP